jgi:hypothetical protein
VDTELDPDANYSNQIYTANEIITVWNKCGDDGEFTEVQEATLIHAAYALAELVLSLNDWKKAREFYGN